MKSNNRIIILLFTVSFVMNLFSQENSFISKREIPVEYKSIYNFLESLKWPKKYENAGYHLENTPIWNVKILMGQISEGGVLFIDPNTNLNKRITREDIENQINSRKGNAFKMISHMTSIYSIPYKQYSELKFKKLSNDVKVSIGYDYELTFKYIDNVYRLTKCEYLALEGD